ncbi:RDD family protein [Paenibacillus xanthanilyticus]|uniref:RDD family protein n=1 Tax=Paenibacillus xanthanilyticus TaxID=1783531 RepID=A0ABV8K6L6_9BACL
MDHMYAIPVGFWARLGGVLMDGLIFFIPFGFIGLLIFGEWNGNKAWSYSVDALSYLYMIFLPLLWGGRTLGKKAIGARIIRVSGQPLGIGTMLLRTVVSNILYAVTFGIVLMISAIMVGVRDDKRSVHDFIAGTQVVADADR